MFDKEFYPTPTEVLELMQIDCNNKIVLEPSAGKGNIVDYLKSQRAKEVIAFEKNKELRTIVSTKCEVYGDDFFNCTSEQISHVDMIVMNPPFSNADKHIEHAFEIAPEGCEIIALCNYETINKWFRHRKLKRLIENYGDAENLGNCFDKAERKTNVEIGLVKLFKPIINDDSKFDEVFFMDEDEEEQYNGKATIMPYDEVKALVNRYKGAVKVFDKMRVLQDEINYTTKPLGAGNITLNFGRKEKIESKEQFLRELQINSWSYLFSRMNMQKYVTQGVMEKINRFVKKQSKYPFTQKNIYKMLEIIVATRQQSFNEALEEAIDYFTMYTKENRFGVEGWKTNSGYMLNQKFIINEMVEQYYSDRLSLKFNSNIERLEDLVKVICNVVGFNYSETISLRKLFNSNKGLERGRWYDWGFFEIKVFIKGTMHLKFKDVDTWYRLNKAYGELKGFTLAENYTN